MEAKFCTDKNYLTEECGGVSYTDVLFSVCAEGIEEEVKRAVVTVVVGGMCGECRGEGCWALLNGQEGCVSVWVRGNYDEAAGEG